jgi:orotate phosphoribosyltransferase-like protein
MTGSNIHKVKTVKMRKLSDTKEKILFRRGMVTELKAKGLADGAIAERLGVARTCSLWSLYSLWTLGSS